MGVDRLNLGIPWENNEQIFYICDHKYIYIYVYIYTYVWLCLKMRYTPQLWPFDRDNDY